MDTESTDAAQLVDVPKRGPGRPRKNPADLVKPEKRPKQTNFPLGPHPRQIANRNATSFPKPTSTIFREKSNCKKGFEYWHQLSRELSEDQKARVNIRIYRNWPVCDRKLVDAAFTQDFERLVGTQADGQSDNPPAFPPIFTVDDFKAEVLHRYGAGTYKFILLEEGVPGAICIWVVDVSDDFDKFPPRLDLRELMIGHPSNNSFIAHIRMRGTKLPGDAGYENTEEGEQEMKVVTEKIVGDLADLNRTVGRLEGEKEATNRQRKGQQENGQQQQTQKGDSADVAIKMLDVTNSMLNRGFEAAREVATKGSSGGMDFKSMMTGFAEVMKVMKPETDDKLSKALDEMRAEMKESRKEFLAALKEMSNPGTGLVTSDGEGHRRSSPISQLKELAEAAEIFGWKRPGNDDKEDDEDKETKKNSDLEKITAIVAIAAPAITGLFATAANIIYNIAAQKMGQKPEPPPSLTGQPATTEVVSQPSAGQPAATETSSSKRFLEQITEPLIAHFFGDETSGVTFAHWIITEGTGATPTVAGRKFYEQMREAGKESIVKTFSTHPPIWSQIQGVPQRLDKFIEDFLNYDSLIQEDEDEPETNTKPN